MTQEERKRTGRIAHVLSWGVIALIPGNLFNAWHAWHMGDPALSAVSVTVAMYSAWSSRRFIRFQLLQLALCYVKKEIARQLGEELTGFKWITTEQDKEKPPAKDKWR